MENVMLGWALTFLVIARIWRCCRNGRRHREDHFLRRDRAVPDFRDCGCGSRPRHLAPRENTKAAGLTAGGFLLRA
jgi:hypothetical protein